MLAAGIRGDYAQAPADRKSEIISGNDRGGRSIAVAMVNEQRIFDKNTESSHYAVAGPVLRPECYEDSSE